MVTRIQFHWNRHTCLLLNEPDQSPPEYTYEAVFEGDRGSSEYSRDCIPLASTRGLQATRRCDERTAGSLSGCECRSLRQGAAHGCWCSEQSLSNV
jgi:hypothetical protein